MCAVVGFFPFVTSCDLFVVSRWVVFVVLRAGVVTWLALRVLCNVAGSLFFFFIQACVLHCDWPVISFSVLLLFVFM